MQILLASTSRYRRALLERVGLDFDGVAPEVDEDAHKDSGLAPRKLAETLADAKAAAVAARFPDAIVIGSDQVGALGPEILSKPGNAERAVAQLQRMSGQTHELITAVTVRRGDELRRHTDVARLTMRPLGRAALERYVAADRPLDCAGSYKLEERGIALFERVECEDHSAITGLPMLALVRILSEFGVELP